MSHSTGSHILPRGPKKPLQALQPLGESDFADEGRNGCSGFRCKAVKSQ
jgi:hypothetical protein